MTGKKDGGAAAWAVEENGVIDVKSVAPTRLAAIINFLCTERGWMARRETSNEFILTEWRIRKGAARALKVEVRALIAEPGSKP